MDDNAREFNAKYPIQASSVSHDIETMKTLLNKGIPFLAGLRVYESFDTNAVKRTGIVPMPQTRKEKYKGYHAVVFAGYDDEKYGGSFFVRNSWGKDWGIGFNGKDKVNGYFWLPYKYAAKHSLASDFWTISKLVVPEKAYLSDDDDDSVAVANKSCWDFFFPKRKAVSHPYKEAFPKKLKDIVTNSDSDDKEKAA